MRQGTLITLPTSPTMPRPFAKRSAPPRPASRADSRIYIWHSLQADDAVEPARREIARLDAYSATPAAPLTGAVLNEIDPSPSAASDRSIAP
jgi:hypothetical protein